MSSNCNNCSSSSAKSLAVTQAKYSIITYNYQFHPVFTKPQPRGSILNVECDSECRQAHLNIVDFIQFIDNALQFHEEETKSYVANIFCIGRSSYDRRQWTNAGWCKQRRQAFFGQKDIAGQLRSYALDRTVVGHEFSHQIISDTAALEYAEESGALDESFADIFAILFFNKDRSDIGEWIWRIGIGLNSTGQPIRDISNPHLCNQPDTYEEYNRTQDCHYNCGIHNKALYNLLTYPPDNPNIYLFDGAISVARLLFLALAKLSSSATFCDSRRALQQAAGTLYRSDPVRYEEVKRAIAYAFDAVGIPDIPDDD